MALSPLERLALNERERGVGEDTDGVDVSRCSKFRERAGEEVVAAGAGDVDAVRRPDGRAPAPQVRAVDHVVVDESRQMEQLDGDAGGERRQPVGSPGSEEHEHRPQALAAGRDRLLADGGDDSRPRLDRALQP